MADEKIKKYNSDSIEVLEGLEAVRKIPGMYIGSTGPQGLHHLIWEILDNAVDEALNGFGDKITVSLNKDGSCTVADEGRGIPVDIHPTAKIPSVQLIFTTLHSGGKFNDNAYKSSAGLHGVGSSVVNALSEYCDVTVYKDGKINHIRFEKGGKLAVPLEVLGPTKKHGTTVTFKPDKKIFPSTEFSFEKVESHLKEDSYLLKKVRFILIDERSGIKEEFYHEHGLKEFVEDITAEKTKLGDVITITGNESKIDVDIALQYCYNDYNETIRSYVNNVHTAEGGTHEVGFKTGITKAVNDYAESNNLLKGKSKLEGSDIREGLTAVISLKMPESLAEFEGQTKGKNNTAIALSIVQNLVYTQFTYYLNENKEFAVRLIKKCQDSASARIAARKAKDEARKARKVSKETVVLSDKLCPCSSKNPKINELFIVEGNSAGGLAKKARYSQFQAILPLRGKPLNTDGLTISKIKENEEFATIIEVLGAGVGQTFDVDDIKFDKVIIMTDADTDGSHIQTLLLTFFYNFMRDLITEGHVYIAVPPLYRVFKRDKDNNDILSVYAWKDEDLADAKKQVGDGYQIERNKGLGEMNPDELKSTTMDPKTRTLVKVTINDPLVCENEVSILMGKSQQSMDKRKKWIENNVDFSMEDSFMEEARTHG